MEIGEGGEQHTHIYTTHKTTLPQLMQPLMCTGIHELAMISNQQCRAQHTHTHTHVPTIPTVDYNSTLPSADHYFYLLFIYLKKKMKCTFLLSLFII